MVFPVLRQSAGVITFRIGDLGFGIEMNKVQGKDLFRIPQSAFLNLESPGALLLPRPELLQVFQARPERRLFMRLESNQGSLFLIV